MYSVTELAALFPGNQPILPFAEHQISQVCIDSRKAAWQSDALFIALRGARTDGHRYIREAWERGIRNFLVQQDADLSVLPEANYILVPDVLQAFHRLAAFHRSQFSGKVVAITGSNGKTWVKEWLYVLLYRHKSVYRSPGSFNSQVGVPLSVWNIPLNAEIAIIEAGVSRPGEMAPLEEIIRPDLVIFTRLGDAHDEGFNGDKQWKLEEKLELARRASKIIYPEDEDLVRTGIRHQLPDIEKFGWSFSGTGRLQAKAEQLEKASRITLSTAGHTFNYNLPYAGTVPVTNSLSCAAALIALDLPPEPFLAEFEEVEPIDMRLKAETAIQDCVLINDSYSLDLDSLQYALESLVIAGRNHTKTLILSDHAFGRPAIYRDLTRMITGAGIDKLICIGEGVSALASALPATTKTWTFLDVDEFFRSGVLSELHHEAILLKGARRFGFERIARHLRLRSHSAVLKVDMAALDHNLRYFYQRLKPGVRKVAVVKANAYGAGSMEICRFLAWQNIDMLAVAVTDEGIELREAGLSLPVIVLNPDPEGMDLILQHHLEPEIYNVYALQKLDEVCRYRQERAIVHLKLDAGTHRLGFGEDDLNDLISLLRDHPWIRLGSIFSHLSASDDPAWDEFTREQVSRFDNLYRTLSDAIGYTPPRHILSTAGILRFPEYQFEGVRLGIGLYGVGVPGEHDLLPVHSLTGRILHIQHIDAGESVSYGRSFIAESPRRIATVNLGYADGIPRQAGEKGCTFRLQGKEAPITGRVCMDMTMIDVSHIAEAAIGDEVIIFDKEHSIEKMAKACGTIPYEILTHLNPRIRKVYEHSS